MLVQKEVGDHQVGKDVDQGEVVVEVIIEDTGIDIDNNMDSGTIACDICFEQFDNTVK